MYILWCVVLLSACLIAMGGPYAGSKGKGAAGEDGGKGGSVGSKGQGGKGKASGKGIADYVRQLPLFTIWLRHRRTPNLTSGPVTSMMFHGWAGHSFGTVREDFMDEFDEAAHHILFNIAGSCMLLLLVPIRTHVYLFIPMFANRVQTGETSLKLKYCFKSWFFIGVQSLKNTGKRHVYVRVFIRCLNRCGLPPHTISILFEGRACC